MESVPSDGGGDAFAGLIVGDGSGQYFAIAWADLQRYRVPAAWVSAVAAVVHGAEPAERGDEPREQADARTLSADHARFLEAVTATGRLRLAALRLEAWTLLR